MRYIGSKQRIIPFIRDTIQQTYGDFSEAVVGDLFAGTACVAEMFKHEGARVLSNDYMHFSHALQVEKIQLNREPDGPLPYRELLERLNALPGQKGFFYREYTQEGTQNAEFVRNYFSADNAMRIDAIRRQIQLWLDEGTISADMFYLLVANLVEAVTRVSNTSGTYGAFLKGDDARKTLPIRLQASTFFDNQKENRCYCRDIFSLLDEVEGDILYLDPPYNSRQYPPYYHILETTVLYDDPPIYGKTGRRPYQDKLSPLCMADKAAPAMTDIVRRARFPHIYISYSTDGIIDYSRWMEELRAFADVQCYFRVHRRYKSNSGNGGGPQNKLKEILIHVQK